MPIKPENRARYPENWAEIRERILRRANHQCEDPGCGAPNGAMICRDREDLEHWVLDDPDAPPDPEHFRPAIRVVLTLAHLDHTPENCDDNNLRALCQLHHLRLDAEEHAASAKATRAAKANAS